MSSWSKRMPACGMQLSREAGCWSSAAGTVSVGLQRRVCLAGRRLCSPTRTRASSPSLTRTSAPTPVARAASCAALAPPAATLRAYVATEISSRTVVCCLRDPRRVRKLTRGGGVRASTRIGSERPVRAAVRVGARGVGGAAAARVRGERVRRDPGGGLHLLDQYCRPLLCDGCALDVCVWVAGEEG